MILSVRGRILAILLMEKVSTKPEYAQSLGIETHIGPAERKEDRCK